MQCLLTRRWIAIGMLVVVLLVVLTVGFGQAQEPGPAGDTLGTDEVEATLGDVVPIQGRLTDAAGSPLNGYYNVTASIYDVSTGGTARCSDVDSVMVDSGLFNMNMNSCNPPDIDGRQLYLGITVEADDEMEPHQPIYAVPYTWSLRPGAHISGTVSGGAVVHVENSSTSGRGLRGYATADSGTNYGVVGRSSSPDGYGGYFANDGEGYALGVAGGMRMTVNAGPAKSIEVGDRYRDNAIVAWAKTEGGDPGSIPAESASLIPMAIAEIDAAPVGAGEIRIVSVNQLQTNVFNVYINNGNGSLVDNDFIFMVTAR